MRCHGVFSWDLEDIRAALAGAGDLEELDMCGRTALLRACEGHEPELAQALLAAGAKLEVRDRAGRTPLHLALRHCPRDDLRLRLCETLLAAGAAVDVLDDEGVCPLAQELVRCDADATTPVFERLLAAARDVDLRKPRGKSPLALALHHARSAVARALVQRGADRKKLPPPAQLAAAAAIGDVAGVRALLRRGVDPAKFRGEQGWGVVTTLQLAVAAGDATIVQLLLAAGAPPDLGGYQATPLQLAVSARRPDLVHLLIDAGSQEASVGLGVAAAAGDLEMIELLLTHAPARRHAIVRAALADQPGALARLLRGVASAECPGEPSTPALPLVLVVEQRHHAVLRLLVEAGARLDHRADDGRTLQQVAAATGDAELIALVAGGPPPVDRFAELWTRWREQLARHRQAWPEWETLAGLAAQREPWSWRVEQGRDWLVHATLPLRVDVTADPLPAPLPAWFAPLYRLGQRPGHGALGGAAQLGRLSPRSLGDFFHAGVRLPAGGLWALQTTRTGALLGLDREGRVLGWDTRRGDFVALGPLAAVTRWCLHHLLAGVSWDMALETGTDLAAFGLRPLALPD